MDDTTHLEEDTQWDLFSFILKLVGIAIFLVWCVCGPRCRRIYAYETGHKDQRAQGRGFLLPKWSPYNDTTDEIFRRLDGISEAVGAPPGPREPTPIPQVPVDPHTYIPIGWPAASSSPAPAPHPTPSSQRPRGVSFLTPPPSPHTHRRPNTPVEEEEPTRSRRRRLSWGDAFTYGPHLLGAAQALMPTPVANLSRSSSTSTITEYFKRSSAPDPFPGATEVRPKCRC